MLRATLREIRARRTRRCSLTGSFRHCATTCFQSMGAIIDLQAGIGNSWIGRGVGGSGFVLLSRCRLESACARICRRWRTTSAMSSTACSLSRRLSERKYLNCERFCHHSHALWTGGEVGNYPASSAFSSSCLSCLTSSRSFSRSRSPDRRYRQAADQITDVGCVQDPHELPDRPASWPIHPRVHEYHFSAGRSYPHRRPYLDEDARGAASCALSPIRDRVFV